nr:peptide-methionine (S)-S-oxide reductase MsrA [uncultured Halomonas sp.]
MAAAGFASASLQAQSNAEATFAGGCFWCMEPPYNKQVGVSATISGYMGGELENPTYEQISRGGTDHIEVVQIEYDDSQISYEQLLEIFWRNIDPFAVDGQFCDVGDQYRSAIFYQEITTDILPASEFWTAEEYHQDYYEKNPLRYKFYRLSCGRDDRLEEVWGEEAGGPTFE